MIYTVGPSVTEREIAYVTDAITHGLNEHSYDYLKRLEQSFAEYVGVRHAFATSSCTGALHLTLLALGIGPGDEVIVPDMTWVATAAPVVHVGATPVFVDIERDTWCMDPHSFERAITARTKAVMVVHTYGYPADMPAINAIAKARGVLVIEDAAPSLGSTLHGKRTGNFGHVSAFSFHGSKIVAAGEGGMLCTNDEGLMNTIRVIANHGRDGGRMLTAVRWGIKYNMSNLQAAFALAQLERIDELFAKKRLNYEWYKHHLSGIEGLGVSVERPEVTWNVWHTSILLERNFGLPRDRVMEELKKVGVDSRPFFPCLSSLPMVGRNLSRENPVSYDASERGINLPSRHDLTEEDVAYIALQIRRILGV